MQTQEIPYNFSVMSKYYSTSQIFDLIEQLMVFAASEFPEEFDSRRDRFAQILSTKYSQLNINRYSHPDTKYLHVKESMAEKVSDERVFCLYGLEPRQQRCLAVIATVSTTTHTPNAELVNYAHRFESLPDKSISSIELPLVFEGTTLVSVGDDFYYMGGGIETFEPCNKVKKFEPGKIGVHTLRPCHDMIQPRAFSALVFLDKKIFVFGGLAISRNNSTPWAEFLDINKPEIEQKWKALEEPMFRPCRLYGCTKLFAIPYDTQTILIGCGHDIENALLYSVADGSWSKYNFSREIRLWSHMDPIAVVGDKTMYWTHGTCLIAYELDKHIHYFANMTDSVLLESFFQNGRRPILVHLKDKLFGIFMIYFNDLKQCTVVECIKVQVSKGHQGNLELKVVGYQSYRCDTLYNLRGALSI